MTVAAAAPALAEIVSLALSSWSCFGVPRLRRVPRRYRSAPESPQTRRAARALVVPEAAARSCAGAARTLGRTPGRAAVRTCSGRRRCRRRAAPGPAARRRSATRTPARAKRPLSSAAPSVPRGNRCPARPPLRGPSAPQRATPPEPPARCSVHHALPAAADHAARLAKHPSLAVMHAAGGRMGWRCCLPD